MDKKFLYFKGGKMKPLSKRQIKLAGAFLLIFISWLFFLQYLVAEKYAASVRVIEQNEQVKANINATGLDYGELSKGNSSTRFITLENNGGSSFYIIIFKVGNIGNLLTADKNNFVLSPGKIEKVEFLLEVPKETDKKTYQGKIVIFKIPTLQ